MNLGDQFDHYRIDSIVSRGPVATVFRGTDLRNNHSVAIKVLHPDTETTRLRPIVSIAKRKSRER